MSIQVNKRLALLMMFCLVPDWAFAARAGQETSTVALTVTVSKDVSDADRDLATTLLTLLEVEVAQGFRLSVVERQQLDLALHELALSVDLAKSSEKKLKLGKLVNADLLLTMEFPPRDKDSGVQNVLVRIVESLTGAIRGVVATSVESLTIDESAATIAEYLSVVAARPSSSVVTVAIAPFESLGRFDRLRPMELGLRDMIATRLRRWGDLDSADDESRLVKTSDETRQTAVGSPFMVLQRSNMTQLLKELDLVQSGLVDKSRLPKSLPTRAAAYLIHGTIDERNENGFEIIVSAKLVHAASGKTVREFELVSIPKDLPQKLATQIDLIAGFLRHPDGSVSRTPGMLREINETELLFSQVVKDLSRYGRLTPCDFSSRGFKVPKEISRNDYGGGTIRVDTPQHRHILRKSIDRLKSTLFIMPDRADVCYALGFCYAYHVDGIMNLERADELLRRAFAIDPESPVGVTALRVLSEACFHHQLGKCKPENARLAVSQLLFAFRSMPKEARNNRWSRIPGLIYDVYPKDDPEGRAAVTEEIASVTESAAGFQYTLAMNSAAFQSDARLVNWAMSDQPALAQVACRTLGHRSWGKKDFRQSSKWFLKGADVVKESNSSFYDNFRIHAGRALVAGNLHREALELLETFRPEYKNDSPNLGYWASAIGACYEALGHPKKALDIYVDVADRSRDSVNNSDIVERINRLGGVPLSEDREVDVRYVPEFPGGIPLHLETDGNLIFAAGTTYNSTTRERTPRIYAFDPTSETWKDYSPENLATVTCLDWSNGVLWVGTTDGLWKSDRSGSHWKRFSTEEGLPDAAISAVHVAGEDVYVGVGNRSSGGLVQIAADGAVTIMEGEGAPRSGPVDIIKRDGFLNVSSGGVVQQQNIKTGEWEKLGYSSVARVFDTASEVVASTYQKELFTLDELRNASTKLGNRAQTKKDQEKAPPLGSLKIESRYSKAWFPRGMGHAGYQLGFAVEWGDEIWFGGSPWNRFQSVGLYRIHKETGEFTMFKPRDGFRTSTTYSTHDAVLRENELWITTYAGLAVVTRRDPG
ncbi:MAG: tetratricopeptide repeat protein [Planctomycetota bacterium]|nr:tetratricopeptide repeat protein [Planctomycetota bacterium]